MEANRYTESLFPPNLNRAYEGTDSSFEALMAQQCLNSKSQTQTDQQPVQFEELKKEFGEEEARILVSLFSESADRLFRDCELALSQNDPALLKSAAHELKGAASAVRAEGIAAVSLELEQLAKQESLDEGASLTMQLKQYVQDMQRYVEEIV
jgi:HPt (histidine-containing phosphotransfer) domain-containing protein